MTQVVCEIDGALNECLYFRPLQRRLRGRFDYMRDSEPMAKVMASEQPGPIPGQQIGYDFDQRAGFVGEPLHADENAAIRERIQGKGFRLGPEREDFADADEATWHFWLQSAVDAGVARVVDGKFPPKLNGKPKKDFLNAERQTPNDRLAVAIERQNELFAALLKKLS